MNVQLKLAPSFVSYSGPIEGFSQNEPAAIEVGSSLSLEFSSSSESLAAGVAVGEVVFGVTDDGSYPGCIGNDIRVEVEVVVSPEAELNQLGGISAVGFTLATIVILATFAAAGWSYKYRKNPVVTKMQPPFLFAILFGVLVLGSAMIPLSIDDGIATERGCDVSCMATPWLFSMGACIIFSALFSKLWRINRLLGSGMRRVTLKERDVIIPAVVMFSLNMIILVCWTAISPLQWERVTVNNEAWNTVGICSSENQEVGTGFWIAIGVLNIGALILSGWEAYKARSMLMISVNQKGLALQCILGVS